ncbi:hypothetical protein DBV15_03988 [Temnothorax longispinosus]|uniref:Uncharacterized protein n=1 Tax=Temnothorax longispinosus TaxID=300112 RepID=A0A4S2L4H1_9HYME|nr:hypothetical protein DBV15_03988 [Temnothorax longispinosus]
MASVPRRENNRSADGRRDLVDGNSRPRAGTERAKGGPWKPVSTRADARRTCAFRARARIARKEGEGSRIRADFGARAAGTARGRVRPRRKRSAQRGGGSRGSSPRADRQQRAAWHADRMLLTGRMLLTVSTVGLPNGGGSGGGNDGRNVQANSVGYPCTRWFGDVASPPRGFVSLTKRDTDDARINSGRKAFSLFRFLLPQWIFPPRGYLDSRGFCCAV